MIQASTKLSEEIYKRVEKESKENYRSISAQVRMIIEEYYKMIDKK